ncbi:hypothetical protein BU17DRAFT_61633 [Hysterangium stoloniferum]|nr:hypothetical protein BU17DRAFT_61633 [Hysterangium stoloniferum]
MSSGRSGDSGDDRVSLSTFPMHAEQQRKLNSSLLDPAMAALRSAPAGPQTASTLHTNGSAIGLQSKNHPDSKFTASSESPPRPRRSSISYFSIPKIFTSRRRPDQHPTPRVSEHALGDVIEIGRSQTQSTLMHDNDSENADAERERLRDAAAHALGLGISKDTASSATPDPSHSDSTENTPASPYYHPTVLSPSSHPSLTTSTNNHSHTTVHTNPHLQRSDSDTLPPYPCTLAALMPFLQASVALHKLYPSHTFLALSLNRAKQWKVRYVVLTSPSPNLPSKRTHSHTLLTRQSYLHLFKNAVPDPGEMELDRLEINEDSVVYIAEQDVAGKRGVMNVGGRDMTAEKLNASRRNMNSTSTEINLEEMGRTMWLLKLSTEQDTQRWMGQIKASVLLQRAERAGVSFNYPNGQNLVYVPNMRADLEGVLSSLHSNGHLNGSGLSPTSPYPPPLTLSIPNPTRTGIVPLPRPPLIQGFLLSGACFAHHHHHQWDQGDFACHPRRLGDVPARERTGKIRMMTPRIRRGEGREREKEKEKEKDEDLEHKDIDPIAADDTSLSHRLLNVFRSPSRTSQNHRMSGPVPPPTNGRVSMQPHSPVTSLASLDAHTLIGRPISPAIYSVEGRRNESMVKEKKANGVAHPAYSVDWSTPRADTSGKSQPAPSLSPPPRNPRRPSIRENATAPAPAPPPNSNKRETAPSFSPNANPPLRAPSIASMISYTSGNPDQHHVQKAVLPSPPAPWPHPHPYSTPSMTSKRVSTNSVNSLGIPPPRPPPAFAPPPIPVDEDSYSTSTGRDSTVAREKRDSTGTRRDSLGINMKAGRVSMNGRESMLSTHRESLVTRSLRLALSPAAPPPTQSLPPRPDEPGFHRRNSGSTYARTDTLYPITSSPASIYTELSFISPPPPPSGPLPPTPDDDKARDRLNPNSNPTPSRAAYNRRLRIMSPPTSPTDPNDMFLNLQDTPITPAMSPATGPFFVVAPPKQPDEPETEQELTPLSPPPRRSSRGSKEIRKLKDHEKEKDELMKPPAVDGLESKAEIDRGVPQDLAAGD